MLTQTSSPTELTEAGAHCHSITLMCHKGTGRNHPTPEGCPLPPRQMNPETAHLHTFPAKDAEGEPWLLPLPASVDRSPSTRPRLPVLQSLA